MGNFSDSYINGFVCGVATQNNWKHIIPEIQNLCPKTTLKCENFNEDVLTYFYENLCKRLIENNEYHKQLVDQELKNKYFELIKHDYINHETSGFPQLIRHIKIIYQVVKALLEKKSTLQDLSHVNDQFKECHDFFQTNQYPQAIKCIQLIQKSKSFNINLTSIHTAPKMMDFLPSNLKPYLINAVDDNKIEIIFKNAVNEVIKNNRSAHTIFKNTINPFNYNWVRNYGSQEREVKIPLLTASEMLRNMEVHFDQKGAETIKGSSNYDRIDLSNSAVMLYGESQLFTDTLTRPYTLMHYFRSILVCLYPKEQVPSDESICEFIHLGKSYIKDPAKTKQLFVDFLVKHKEFQTLRYLSPNTTTSGTYQGIISTFKKHASSEYTMIHSHQPFSTLLALNNHSIIHSQKMEITEVTDNEFYKNPFDWTDPKCKQSVMETSFDQVCLQKETPTLQASFSKILGRSNTVPNLKRSPTTSPKVTPPHSPSTQDRKKQPNQDNNQKQTLLEQWQRKETKYPFSSTKVCAVFDMQCEIQLGSYSKEGVLQPKFQTTIKNFRFHPFVKQNSAELIIKAFQEEFNKN